MSNDINDLPVNERKQLANVELLLEEGRDVILKYAAEEKMPVYQELAQRHNAKAHFFKDTLVPQCHFLRLDWKEIDKRGVSN